MDDKHDMCKIPVDQEIVTEEENGKPPLTIINEGPTQPEERVQMNDELEKAEEAADEDSDEIKPEKSGSFAVQSKKYMQIALDEAKKAIQNGDVPVGAIIVKDDQIIARAYNKKELLQDPTAHAEILAIREAAKNLGSWHLDDCTMYVTLEPCPMCLSAIFDSRIKRIYYGAHEPKTGAVESRLDLGKSLNKSIEIYPGILEEKSKELLKDFFLNIR